MKKAGVIFAVSVLLLYGGVSWFFAGLILNGSSRAYSEARAIERLTELNFEPMGAALPVVIRNGEVMLAASYYEHPEPAGCAIVAMHGRGGNRIGSFWFAQPFWDRGCHFLSFDHRGFGDSSAVAQTYGYHEREDAAAAFVWLLDHTGLSNEDVGLVGVSYGAATSLQALEVRDDYGFILADSAYQSLQLITQEQGDMQFGTWTRLFLPGAYLFTNIRGRMWVGEVAPVESVSGKQTPILLIHALEDGFTAAHHSEAIFANSNQATTVLHITDWGAGHGASVDVDYESYSKLIDDFLSDYAPAFGN